MLAIKINIQGRSVHFTLVTFVSPQIQRIILLNHVLIISSNFHDIFGNVTVADLFVYSQNLRSTTLHKENLITLSSAERSQEGIIFSNYVVIDVFNYFGNFFIFLWDIGRTRPLSGRSQGIIFRKRKDLPVPVRLSYSCSRCHFLFIIWHKINIRRFAQSLRGPHDAH